MLWPKLLLSEYLSAVASVLATGWATPGVGVRVPVGGYGYSEVLRVVGIAIGYGLGDTKGWSSSPGGGHDCIFLLTSSRPDLRPIQ
jgi:hypothetical protein